MRSDVDELAEPSEPVEEERWRMRGAVDAGEAEEMLSADGDLSRVDILQSWRKEEMERRESARVERRRALLAGHRPPFTI